MPFNQIGYGLGLKKVQPVTLPGGATYTLPAGQYAIDLGLYSFIQYWDPVTQIWRVYNPAMQTGLTIISADGYNWRLANLTGCMIGAYLTNGGSGYPNGIYPAGTPAVGSYVTAVSGAGTATWNVIVGGCINTTVTVTTAGVGYNNPPTLIFSDPPAGGVRATAIAAVSAGAISSVTVINQGAGYSSAPTITVVPNPLDLPGAGQTNVGTPAVLTATLTNSGRVTAVTSAGNYGGGAYATVPSITFAQSAGSSAAATPVGVFTVTASTSPGGGSANQTASVIFLTSAVLASAKTNAPINPDIEQGIFNIRPGWCTTTLSSGVASAIAIQDGGMHQVAAASILQPTAAAWGTAAPTSSSAGTLATAAGGVNDTSILFAL